MKHRFKYKKMLKEYPRLFNFKEKYGDTIYIVNSPEEYDRLWLNVLTERFEQKDYNWMKDHVPYNFEIPTYSLEDIEALPSTMEKEKENMKIFLKVYNKKLKEQNETRNLYKNIETTVLNKRTANAYSILDKLSNGEYEGFEEIYPQRIKL